MACYLWEEADPNLATASFQMVVDKVCPEPPFLWTKHSLPPQLLLVWLLLQPSSSLPPLSSSSSTSVVAQTGTGCNYLSTAGTKNEDCDYLGSTGKGCLFPLEQPLRLWSSPLLWEKSCRHLLGAHWLHQGWCFHFSQQFRGVSPQPQSFSHFVVFQKSPLNIR